MNQVLRTVSLNLST